MILSETSIASIEEKLYILGLYAFKPIRYTIVKLGVLVVVFGFSAAIVAAMYASVYVSGLLVVATAYVAYVIKSDNPHAPNIFKDIAKGDK